MISKGEKKLFLIDAYALIYRAYFAFAKNPRITSKGFDVSAIYGFINTLLDTINKEKPSYLGVVFDTPKKTHRHLEYTEYKANRDATPEGVSAAIPYIKKILNAFNIPTLFVHGFEADDVIGTLSKQAEAKSWNTFMMTPDKDFAQLVSKQTFMYKPGLRGNANEVWDTNIVCERFDIHHVDQVVDFLGMVGDSVDNIPGIKGIGPKTASKLLKKYGSLEQIYTNIHELDGKLKDKISNAKNEAFLSKKLAKIVTDVPINIDEYNLELSNPDLSSIEAIFDELEFKRILNRVISIFDMTPENNKISNGEQLDLFSVRPKLKNSIFKKGIYIATIIDLQNIIQKLINYQSLAFFYILVKNTITGLSISWSKDESGYIIFNKDINLETCLDLLSPIFRSTDIEKIFFDSKSFIKTLSEYNHFIQGPVFDIVIADYLIDPDSNRTLLGIIQKHNIETINIELLDLDNRQDFATYLIELACLLIILRKLLLKILENNNLKKLFYDVELPLVSVLLNMEEEGVSIDKSVLLRYSENLSAEMLKIEHKIFQYANHEFNIASPKQLGDVLFNKMQLLEKPKKTKSGQFATNESELMKLRNKHEIINQILLFRSHKKLLSTYVNALPLLADKNNKIHTTFNHTITNTGRLSSSNPNLQNIPIRKEIGKDVRKAFISSGRDYVLMAADYSQIELRLIAHLSQEDNMIDAFLNQEDIHTSTASKVFNVDLDLVTNEMRSSAKTVNFGIIYGVSAFGLSEQSTLSRKESAELIKTYFLKYPKLKLFIDNQVSFAKKHGYVHTILGRKRYLRNINSRNSFIRSHDERNAVNMPVQGSAADIIKLAMIKIAHLFHEKKIKSKMILQVHDELVFNVLKTEQTVVKDIVEHTMENICNVSVPLKVDIGFGANWLEAH